MSYLAYHFLVEPPQPGSEILVAMIAEMGFESFDFSDNGFSAYINKEQKNNINLDLLSFEDFTYSFTVEEIETTNWNAEWEKNFEPVVVDDLLCVRAPFHEVNNSVKHEIVIMPKMSFGTGHHQTTRLMCKQLFETEIENKKVLDMGCGTAILAILAMKLGAKEALGIDIDEWSVENSIENCASNGFPQIQIKLGDVDLLAMEAPFDLILANINKNILKSHIPAYSAALKEKGRLFLSGFFSTDVEELRLCAAEMGLNYISMHNENEWAMMVMEKT